MGMGLVLVELVLLFHPELKLFHSFNPKVPQNSKIIYNHTATGY